MPDSFLHERSDFKALVATVADSEKINDPALVEKDYWITFAIRMATCSGSAGDSSLKGRTGCPAGSVRGIEIVLLLAPHPASLGCPCKRPAWSIVVTGLAFCK